MVGTTFSLLAKQLCVARSKFGSRAALLSVQAATVIALAGSALMTAPHAAADTTAPRRDPGTSQHGAPIGGYQTTVTGSRFEGHVDLTNGQFMGPPSPVDPVASYTYSLSFTRLQCIEESGEWGSDEPYVLFFIGNLASPAESVVRRTEVFESVDTGNNQLESVELWRHRLPGGDADNLIILAQVMEHDTSRVADIAAELTKLRARLATYKGQGLSRSEIVERLKSDMADIIEDKARETVNLTLNADDRVGNPLELRFWAANALDVAQGRPLSRTLTADGGSDGRYRVYLEIR